MRRSLGGWFAALALLLAGCGSGPAGHRAAPPAAERVVVPTVAVAAHAPAAPAGGHGLTVLVSSANGVGSPELDALATVLGARPDVSVVVVASADRNETVGETGAPAAPIEARTAGGFPAEAVDAPAADAVATGLDRRPDVDLVVVGIDAGAAVGDDVDRSPAVAAARSAAARGVPAVAVTGSAAGGLDIPAAVLALQQVLDLHLDALVDRGGAGVLSVPSCTAGTARPLVEVEVGRGPAPAADCTTPVGVHDEDVSAHGAGHATFARLRG